MTCGQSHARPWDSDDKVQAHTRNSDSCIMESTYWKYLNTDDPFTFSDVERWHGDQLITVEIARRTELHLKL